MKRIIRVFPRRTSHTPSDDMAFVGDPPLFRPPPESVLEVRVSCTFTWDIVEAGRLADAWAEQYPRAITTLGGPAYGDTGRGFEPGLYVKPGVVYTSRGCDNCCPWCLVPRREGRLRTLSIRDGWIIGDNNFLACPADHRRKVYAMLGQQPHGAVFGGGLQASLVTDEVAAEFRDIRILDVFLAADTVGALGPLERAVSRLQFLGRDRLRCYVLIGYGGEPLEQAEARLRRVWDIGAMPFAQLYQPPTEHKLVYRADWRALARTWSRPAGMKAEMRAG